MTAIRGYLRLALLIAVTLMLAVAGCSQNFGTRDANQGFGDKVEAQPGEAKPGPTTQPGPTTESKLAAQQRYKPAPEPTEAASVPAPVADVFERFVGYWLVHGVQMTIRPDYTGVMSSNVGPCIDPFGPNASDAMCNEIEQLKFSTAPSGGVVATVTSINYETWEGNPPPPGFEPDGTTQVGDSFELEFVDDNLLSDSRGPSGYLYWCNSRTSGENRRKCGA